MVIHHDGVDAVIIGEASTRYNDIARVVNDVRADVRDNDALGLVDVPNDGGRITQRIARGSVRG
jgi:hypothetical protein